MQGFAYTVMHMGKMSKDTSKQDVGIVAGDEQVSDLTPYTLHITP